MSPGILYCVGTHKPHYWKGIDIAEFDEAKCGRKYTFLKIKIQDLGQLDKRSKRN